MVGTCRRFVASHFSTSQAPRLTIQILQNRTVLILEPANSEGSDDILDTATGVHATTTLNATVLPPLLPQSEVVPPPPLPSPQALPPPQTNEVLTNLVNLLCQ
jgi:hypothetical protein